MSGRLVEAMCGVAFTDRLLKGELKWENNLNSESDFFKGLVLRLLEGGDQESGLCTATGRM